MTTPPEEFYKVINDFVEDIKMTFPEYVPIVNKWWKISDDQEKEKRTLFVYKHCSKIFPERFFDILYQNDKIFEEDSDINTEFLPGIVFKQLWSFDISDKTRETIWKYLQLILFSVIGSVNNSEQLGDAAKLFEAINEDELKTKLEETLGDMQKIFDMSGNELPDGINENMNIPNAEDLHSHINNMMNGKLGKLAMELAEETAKDLNLDMENVGSANDVFKTLFKNPGKLMSMVKNIGEKIDAKLKSGEIKESELISEGMEMLNQMKNMPGMGNMQEMFAKMGMPGLGKGGKLNMGAMEAQLNKNLKTAKMKERMRTKIEKKKEQEETAFCNMNEANTPKMTDEEIISIFSETEKKIKGINKKTKHKK
jgi:hypothetical protein